MKLMRVWESSPELKITDMFLPTIIRTIWANPYMKNAPDFGTFKRISKEAEGKHSPFIYGPLSEKTYIALAEGVGNERPGIKIVRRILDHMNVNDHTPSNELLKVLVNESIKGKWPEILLRILQYSHRKGVTVDHAIWMDAISYYRYCLNFFETGLQCIELALKNNVRADWDLIELYANKYLKHEMVPPVELLVKNVKSAMVKQAKNTQDYPQRLFDFNQKFFKCLVRYEEEKKATQYLLEYAKDEKYSEVSIEMGFKHFEEVKDARNSGEFFKQVVAKEGFVYTPKFIAEALRMCSAMKGEASNIVLILRDVILADNLLSSPFSINMIIMNFGYTEDWDKLYQFLLKIKDSKMQINKFTVPTAKKVIAACKDSVMTKRINELVVEFNNLIAA